MEKGGRKTSNSFKQLERQTLILGRKTGSHKLGTNKHGTVYDFILPIAQRSLKKIGLFPVKILLARGL